MGYLFYYNYDKLTLVMHTFLHLPLFLASDWAAAFKVFVLTPSDSFSLFLFICTVVQSVNFLPVLYMISSRRHVPYMSALWSNLNMKEIMKTNFRRWQKDLQIRTMPQVLCWADLGAKKSELTTKSETFCLGTFLLRVTWFHFQ